MKKPVGYKVESEVLNEFNKVANEKSINKSLWIENKMREFLKEVLNGKMDAN